MKYLIVFLGIILISFNVEAMNLNGLEVSNSDLTILLLLSVFLLVLVIWFLLPLIFGTKRRFDLINHELAETNEILRAILTNINNEQEINASIDVEEVVERKEPQPKEKKSSGYNSLYDFSIY